MDLDLNLGRIFGSKIDFLFTFSYHFLVLILDAFLKSFFIDFQPLEPLNLSIFPRENVNFHILDDFAP